MSKSFNEYTVGVLDSTLTVLANSTFTLTGSDIVKFNQLLNELSGFRAALAEGQLTIVETAAAEEDAPF